MEDANGKITPVTINEIVNEMEWDRVDILKIDIEGAERYLFENHVDLTWIDKANVIAIELHAEDIKRRALDIFREKDFEWVENGELTIAYKKIINCD